MTNELSVIGHRFIVPKKLTVYITFKLTVKWAGLHLNSL